ncbi:P1 family peptidase [Roseicyclus sp. F158]|uniref:P1 family peptidase n=1 Tax=Tropicimonas omnivorans TaxID=3075590 RepID=A0ABU3DKK8_9RHOB|nr:P1 family peptidase [Roseicyclus sp. F158]MDT0684251.1 P1 family peptidase [Roseicyclus sp. F158]
MNARSRPGPLNLITDVGGLLVGNAGDDALKSGVTVLTGDRPFTAAVHVMGGAPGTRETDLLAPDKLVTEVDALVLSGGSAFGLDAAGGVMAGLRAAGRGFAVAGQHVPIVPAAILFDLANGGDKDWTESPYTDLGREALREAGTGFDLGREGAGLGAMTATTMGGLGSASLVLPWGATVGALVAVNALGSATIDGGRHFYSAPWEIGGEFGGLGPAMPSDPAARPVTKADGAAGGGQGASTTIAIVATDAKLSQAQAQRMAIAAHDGMARALVPSHTPLDGDLVFAAATGEVPLSDPVIGALDLGHAAATCLARAIARGVHAARPRPGDLLPCWSDLS